MKDSFSSSSSSSTGKLVSTPLPNDVLCGKEKLCIGHVGSKRFRAVIESYRHRYSLTKTKYEKMCVTKEIYESLHRDVPGGDSHSVCRFLKYNNKLMAWEELSPMAARDKVGHALRFANRKKRRTSAAAAVASVVSTCTSSTANTVTSTCIGSYSRTDSPVVKQEEEVDDLEPVSSSMTKKQNHSMTSTKTTSNLGMTSSSLNSSSNDCFPLLLLDPPQQEQDMSDLQNTSLPLAAADNHPNLSFTSLWPTPASSSSMAMTTDHNHGTTSTETAANLGVASYSNGFPLLQDPPQQEQDTSDFQGTASSLAAADNNPSIPFTSSCSTRLFQQEGNLYDKPLLETPPFGGNATTVPAYHDYKESIGGELWSMMQESISEFDLTVPV